MSFSEEFFEIVEKLNFVWDRDRDKKIKLLNKLKNLIEDEIEKIKNDKI